MALILCAGWCVASQNLAAEARQAAERNDLTKAAELYEKLARQNPADANVWEQLGMAQQGSARYREAAASFQRAIDTGYGPAGRYNLACALARLGEGDKAIAILSQLVNAGTSIPMANDADLASLRSDARFQTLLQRVAQAAEPCRHPESHPEYRQLDFWIGDWNVYNTAGSKVGESHIELALKNCVIVENWSGTQGGSGKSYNAYDAQIGKWQQFWVSDGGSTSYFTGEGSPGEMRYVMERKLNDGRNLIRRLTFTKQDGGKVRQLSRRSMDDGKTWITEYDFLYVPKKG